MASPTAAMDTTLYATLNVASVVGTGKASGVFRHRAPHGTALPVVIFGYMDDGADQYTLGKRRAWVRMLYQIKVAIESTSASSISTLADTIDSLVTNVALSVTGFTLMTAQRVRPIAYQEDLEGGGTVQYVGGEYEFMLDPT